MQEIIALGSINVDFQMRIGRWPEPGETMIGHEFLMDGGGKGANVALLARKLGVPARLIARTGDDPLAPLALKRLRQAGVNLRFTGSVDQCSTGIACIMVQPDGDKGIFLASNANDRWDSSSEQAAEAAVRDAPDGSVLVADLEVPAAVVERSLRAARERGFTTVLDPSPAGRLRNDLLSLSDYLTPNSSEAETLTGVKVTSPEAGFECGRALLERGVACVLAKLPGGGCAVISREECFVLMPHEKVEVQDATGAGDAFAGALAVGLLERRDLRHAARMAIETAGLAVTRYGSQVSYPERGDIEGRL